MPHTLALGCYNVKNLSRALMSWTQIFSQADSVIRSVIACLILFSIISWSVILWKMFEQRDYRHGKKVFDQHFQGSWTIESLYETVQKLSIQHPIRFVFQSIVKGLKGKTSPISSTQILDIQLDIAQKKALLRQTRGLNILACISATAPFIGLLGTVWGIINSFAAIAQMQSAQLSVVAPGLAEALYTTALGLFVAIPAHWALHTFTHYQSYFEETLSIASKELRCALLHKISQ